MAYAVKYNMPVRNGLTGDAYLLEIQEWDYSGPTATLKGASVPLMLKYIDNGESKYSAIRASELTISFISALFNMEDIISNDDNKFRVEVKRITPTGAQLNWRGFLSADDLTEEYTSGNRVFNLRATDGLGLLKNETLSVSYGRLTLLEVIKSCLIPTYTDLDISVNCGVFSDEMNDFVFSNPFDQCKIHTRLFTNSADGPSNCYDSLEAIMKAFQCTIFQQGAQWQVKRMPDERLNASPVNTVYNFNTMVGETVSFDWLTELNLDFIPVNASHLLMYQRASSTSTYQHDYVIPEIPANADLSDGARFPFLDTANSKAYLIDFWTSIYGDPDAPLPAGQAYRREVDDVEERLNESYVVLPYFIDDDNQRLVSIDDPYLDKGDIIEWSVDTRVDSIFFAGSHEIGVGRIRLYGDSGQEYIVNFDTQQWEPVSASTPGDYALFLHDFTHDGSDLDAFTSVSITTDPLPEGGKVVFWLMAWGSVPLATSATETHFKNINITAQLFLNNTSFELKGEKAIASDGSTSKRTNKTNIIMGESPKRVIAGNLWKLDADTELISTEWHTYSAPGQVKRLIEINAVDLQYGSFRVMHGLDGDFKGIKWTRKDGHLIGPGNVFEILGTRYVSTNLDIDVANGIFTAKLQELSNDEKDEAFTGTITDTFTYIFGNERS